MMRGDMEINEVKLVNALDCLAVTLADEAAVTKATGAEVGFAGPIELSEDVRQLADGSLEGQANLLCGCNETGYHCLNVNLGRDCREPQFFDLRLPHAGEGCPSCEKPLAQARGIEVGHIFKLGTKYSSKMGATFMSEVGKPAPFAMGCYGIGVSRIAAAAVEQSHDDKGIIWPASIAPFEAVVAVLNGKRDEQRELGDKLYAALTEAGVEVCLDDRKMSPGVKFKDLELLGFPVQVVVGRNAGDGVVEFTLRKDGGREEVAADEVVARVVAALGAAS